MHHQRYIACFVAYLLMQLVHIMLRSKASVLSKLNGITSTRQFLEVNSLSIAGRLIVETAGMFYWMENPSFVSHLPVIGDLVMKWGINFDLSISMAMAYGYTADSILDMVAKIYLPWLQKEIPLPVTPIDYAGRGGVDIPKDDIPPTKPKPEVSTVEVPEVIDIHPKKRT